ncbi:ferritin-like domain-containing protein [Agromyces sp. NPDC056379]|uniref:ferritin-like domain-containing protein n=1 Tax=unclassified Agromyces TaxID=2639701 RepID=UPI0035DBBDEF
MKPQQIGRAMVAIDRAGESGFTVWVEYFALNRLRRREIESEIEWHAPCRLPDATRRAFIRSFQRFQLGEGGDGVHLLASAARAGDTAYSDALALLVEEEQEHSRLFARGLEHLDGPTLSSHWSDTAFTGFRRMLGLRTEIALFLIAEATAMEYFRALSASAPDPVLRGIGRRICTDEVEHLRFQVDRLGAGFVGTSAVGRVLLGFVWGVIAAGAATVLALDHRGALLACGLTPATYWGRAMRQFRRSATEALGASGRAIQGPSTRP